MDYMKGQEVTFNWSYRADVSPIVLVGTVIEVWAGDVLVIEVMDTNGQTHRMHVLTKDVH